MSEIDVKQAAKQLEELIEQVQQGHDIIITKNKEPLARLSSAGKKSNRVFGSVNGEIWMSDDFDEPLKDFQEYM